ncbi:MAG: RagB/SusD family nutrient uptake outer membrane protein, partial [Longimicrobiales bacterium]
SAGCADLDEEIVTGVTGEFFGTPEGADAAITGTYARLRNWYGQQRETTMLMSGTDTWDKGGEAGNDAPFNDYTSALAPIMNITMLRDQWQNLYEAVNAANTAIKFIGESTAIPEENKSVRLGEARFLRAMFYFTLVRTWGDVHLTLEPTEGVVIEASRTPIAQIYGEAIIPDLEIAIANLPLTQPQFGRATGGAAQTLLAEVYLTRADAGDFDRAVELTTEVINSGMYALDPSFENLFCGPTIPDACEFVPANETNPEFIFSVQFTRDGVVDLFGNTLEMYYVMAYDQQAHVKEGMPALGRTLEYGRPLRRVRPTDHLINLFNRETDSRYEDSFQTFWRYPSGDTAIYMPGTDDIDPALQSRPYAVWGQGEYTNVLFPTLKKWLDDKRAEPNQWGGQRDRQVWRLAEVYLMRAEANIRAGRVEAAIPDLNVIRQRAAKPGMDNELTGAELAVLNTDPIDFLLDERERELAGEEFRFFTLTRMGRLVDRVQRFNPNGGPNVQEHHARRPIPQEQIDRTAGGAAAFPQNAGY